ncbi:hypothetical protein JD276_13365 [Leucobacter sp. CSA1]|uniref:IacB n=1 Tax=Leucobacter chromiisoli TaxID=2796471 RepID=A0A934UVK8_9MICO|nr:hypothetical protein [Leucobacter chromiisoli]MBK0420020.1 hypothetical protein [Leucobacter chromiisoli]
MSAAAGDGVRALICIGVRDPFFAADAEERRLVFEATKSAFANLGERFGVRVIGTFDDDTLQVGPSSAAPWTAYILLDAPGYDEVRAIANIIRETPVGEHLMWHYYKIEARIGRDLFFGTE